MDPWRLVHERLQHRDDAEHPDQRLYSLFAQLARYVPESATVTPDDSLERLNAQAMALERAEKRIAALETAAAVAEQRYARSQERIRHLTLEIAEKNKSIEIVNDERLVDQIQHSVARERVAALERENEQLKTDLAKVQLEHESLVQRWMAKAKADADRLNAALGVGL